MSRARGAQRLDTASISQSLSGAFCLNSSHSCEEDAAIGVFARSERFDAYRVSDARWVFQTAATYPNPNGIWGTLLLVPRERTAEVRRLLC